MVLQTNQMNCEVVHVRFGRTTEQYLNRTIFILIFAFLLIVLFIYFLDNISYISKFILLQLRDVIIG